MTHYRIVLMSLLKPERIHSLVSTLELINKRNMMELAVKSFKMCIIQSNALAIMAPAFARGSPRQPRTHTVTFSITQLIDSQKSASKQANMNFT